MSIATPAHPLSTGREVLADVLVPARSAISTAALVVGGAAVVALLAQVSVPLWPVPVTGQTLGVLLVGAALGARRATAAMVTYLAAGLAGLPVFAGAGAGIASLAMPSFGFVVGFIPTTAFIGWLAQRHWDRRPVLALAGFAGASLIPFLVGVPYLGMILAGIGMPHDIGTLLSLGVSPFVIGGVVKAVLAAGLMPLAHRAARALLTPQER